MAVDTGTPGRLRGLKNALASHNHLYLHDLRKPSHLHMDASAHALGATLSQTDDDSAQRLGTCISRKLNPSERNYPTPKMEVLVLVHALRKWKHYTLWSRVLVHNDNAALDVWRTA